MKIRTKYSRDIEAEQMAQRVAAHFLGDHRLEALRRQSRRNYWTGMAWLVILGAMQVPFIYAAWRLFWAP